MGVLRVVYILDTIKSLQVFVRLFSAYHPRSKHFCTSIIAALNFVNSQIELVHHVGRQSVNRIQLAQKLFAKFLGKSTSTEVILFANCSITRKKAIEGGLNCSRSYHIPSRESRLNEPHARHNPILANMAHCDLILSKYTRCSLISCHCCMTTYAEQTQG